MIYAPFVTVLYFLIANYKSNHNSGHIVYKPTKKEFTNILDNLLILETIYATYAAFRPVYNYLSIYTFFGFYLTQDLYFYLVHKYVFHKLFYNLHKIHHSVFSPYHTWHCHKFEQILLNVGSFGFADLVFPLPDWLFPIVVMQQVYTSVNGHTYNSPHSEHHIKYNTHYGNIWIFDWLFG